MKGFLKIILCFSLLTFSATLKLLAEEVNLLITSDLHGWLSSSYLYPNRKPKGLLHLEPHIVALRKKHPDLLLVDGGDTMQGSPYVTFANRFTPQNNLFFNKLRDLGYNAIVVGNHDLEENPTFEQYYGPGDLFVSANLYRRGVNQFQPYKIIHKQGLKIAILGLTTAGLPIWLPPEKLAGLEAKDMITQGQYWVTKIRAEEKPNLLIALVHSGTNPRRGEVAAKSRGITPPNQAYKLLKEIKGIDFAVSGHDHRRIPYKSGQVSFIGATPFVSAGHHAKALLHVTLLRNKGKKWVPKDAIWFKALENEEIASDYKKSISPEYIKWIHQPLPFHLISTDKKRLAECLNQALSLATKRQDLDGTLLPAIRIKSFVGHQGKRLTRHAISEFLSYDNSYFAVTLNRRQLQLASRPNLGRKAQKYNQKFYLNLKEKLDYKQPGFFLKSKDFTSKYRVLVGGYHLSGGGGVAGKLFFPDFLEAKKKGDSLYGMLGLKYNF